MTAADLMADDAMARVRYHIARSAGQHKRAVAKGFAEARQVMQQRHRDNPTPAEARRAILDEITERVLGPWAFLVAPWLSRCGVLTCGYPVGECTGECMR